MNATFAIGAFTVGVVAACYLIAQAVAIADAATLDDTDFGDWPKVPVAHRDDGSGE